MTSATKSSSLSKKILIGLLIFLSLGGFIGGVSMLIDPSGQLMQFPPEMLDNLFFDTFLLPGLFLIVVYGIGGLVVAYGLWKRLPWAWAAAVAISAILIVWILFQLLLWGSPVAIQIFYLILGIVMLGLCFAPGVRHQTNKT